MHRSLLLIFVGLGAVGAPLSAQMQQRARIIGGGNNEYGKCTVEVVVDGAADVEVRGDNAILRNLSGQQAQWRRFECTGRMPANPADFRFSGVDGRGRQTLVRDPRNGGVAVVRIEDPQGGAEGYTFDLMWSGGMGGPYTSGPAYPTYPNNNGAWSADAVRNCEDMVRQQAQDRYNTGDVRVQTRNTQDNRGPRDTLYGTLRVRRGFGQDEVHDFSCNVNMNNGRVLSARIDQTENGRDRQYGDRGFTDRGLASNSQAIQNCQNAVEDRMRGRVEFDSINTENRNGRNDWVVGTARNGRGDAFRFSCNVNLDTGSVRSVDVNRR
jgi:hypothetical protein